MKVLSHASAKNKTKSVRVSNFAFLWVIFKWSHGSEGVKGRVFFPTLENERPWNRTFVMTTFFFLSFCWMSSDTKDHNLLGRKICKASLCWIYVMTTTTIILYMKACFHIRGQSHSWSVWKAVHLCTTEDTASLESFTINCHIYIARVLTPCVVCVRLKGLHMLNESSQIKLGFLLCFYSIQRQIWAPHMNIKERNKIYVYIRFTV